MDVSSLHLVAWPGLTPDQQERVRGLSIPSAQIEFAGGIGQAVVAAEAADGESAVGLAVLDGRVPVGFLLLSRGVRRPDWAPEEAVALTAMRIDRSRQGQGLGQRALGLVDTWVAAHWPGSRRIALCVDDNNPAGRQAYARAGYAGFTAPGIGRIGAVHYLAKALPEGDPARAGVAPPVVRPAAVTLLDHQPGWAAVYAGEATKLAALFGDPAVQLAHIGSTAVPDLCAKPVVDMLLGARSLAQVEAMIPALAGLGYRYRPDHEAELPERRYFVREAAGECRIHLHAVVHGADIWRKHLVFRDALRTHPDLRQRYARLKRELAAHHRDDKAAYTLAKAPFITQVLADLSRLPD
jgi:GrpB-like predicted nucleotidyltransferase (UPF0157 family)/GNAT superfamily N-acetyltransferase